MSKEKKLKYAAELDVSKVIESLKIVKSELAELNTTVVKQSGQTYALNVQIKNVDIQRFFERLDKMFGRVEAAGGDLADKIEARLGKAFEKAFGKALTAIDNYGDALNKSTGKIQAAANKTIEGVTSTYEKSDAQIVKFMNRTERKSSESAKKIMSAWDDTFKAMVKDLNDIGIDTTNWTPKQIQKFWTQTNKVFDKRQTSQALVKGITDSIGKTVEGASTTAFDKIGQVAEKNAKKQGRMLDRVADQAEREAELAQKRIERMEEAQREREEKRLLRQRLYQKNVAEASRMLQDQIAEENAPEEQKLISKYNRAVARIRGIYQSAVEHGRVENPETILAGLTELQQRSFALNNYRLSEQMGITDLNNKLKTTVRRFEEMGTRLNKVSSVVQNSVQAFSTIQSYAKSITSIFTSFARTVLSRISSQVSSLVKESTEAFKSLEVSLIGFKNFFGEETTQRLYQSIKSIAAQAPGLATTDLADYVRQIAPVSGHNADLALNASLGMLKTIQYGGASGSTEMEYVIKNIRDVLAKGKATAIDIRQFNRAMPILEEVLESVGQSQLLKDGVLTIDSDNVDTILAAFAELNTSDQSAVKDIFSQMNKTLSGQWEQFREQFTTNLMEALRGSGVYGGVQNFLMQVNNGAYVQDALARLKNIIVDFISSINWFKVQRIATELWDGLKIIWQGVQDAANNIRKALGGTNTKNVITSFAQWIADLIRGMSDGVAQVVKFVKYLEESGIMNGVSRIIGWFGSMGAGLTKVLATMFSHMTNIAGNVMQLVSRYSKLQIQNKLGVLTQQLDAIPIRARSQLASGSDLLYGTGVASPEVSAINRLSSMLNGHLLKIEANQTGSTPTLGRVETAYHNGNRYVWTDDFDGAGHGAIGTWNKRTGSYEWSGYSNNDMGYARYQQLITQNRLQASDSAFLQRIGNNKYVDKTLKWMKTAGNKLLSFAQTLMGNVIKGGIALTFTESISGIIDSLDMFGDATTVVAGVVKSAGYALTGALVGQTFGGVKGGVVGALVGLGIGIANLIQSIKDEEKKIANTKIIEAMDEADQAMYDQTVELLKKYGFALDKESIVGAGALQQLAYYIKSTPVANRSTEEAVRYYNEAYKMLSVGYKLDEYANSAAYQTLGGNEIDLSNTSGYWFGKLTELIRKYGLAEEQGYYYGNGTSGYGYYRDEDLVEQVPAEELLKNAFPNGVTDEQAEALLTKANELDEEYGKATVDKLQDLLNDNTEFKSALDNIDRNVADILKNIVEFLGKATPENLGEWYGDTAKTQAEGFETHANGWERFLALVGVNSAEYQNEGYGTERGMDKVYYPNVRSKLGQEFENAVDTGDSERAGFLGDWINQVDSYEFGGYSGWLKDWISFILGKLTEYNTTFGRSFRFAHGGIVPAFAASGVDTVPAMLSPGEFVMRQNVVRKAGLGAMYALNRGDLGAAARSLAQNVSNRTWNRNNTSTINSKTTNYNTNNFRILNRGSSARMNSYYSLANRLAF